ncbi:DUF4014 family protein [Escherichia coli]|nr:DUF4014 family protein [Escherichia coli]MDV5032862.1 DUF4014 family protein [Escherichia coli]MDV5077785.1 DUF4014 family protein [Escherichia coli]MDX4966148.1 DUF4014 family protein [Escherichia coli]
MSGNIGANPYTDVTWESFSALHNKINPYKEN